MSESYRIRKKVSAARERGRRMATIRWKRDRERRDKLAALTAEQHPTKIARRIIVIDDERLVRETVIWSFMSRREWQRKERQALAPQTL
jgi:hypothetical protein